MLATAGTGRLHQAWKLHLQMHSNFAERMLIPPIGRAPV